MPFRAPAGLLGALALVLCASGARGEQSLLERPPDMGGTWVGDAGVLHFHFMHRFEATDPPTRKVLNTPTFLLAAGLPGRMLAGARYATSSAVRIGFPNEWEFFGRWSPLAGTADAPPPIALHAGWNQASSSVDAELAAGARVGPVRLLGALRGFSEPYGGDDARGAAALGAVLRLADWLSLSADGATLFDRAESEEVAWGAGVQARIPATPHTLSLHVSNVVTTTLEGASRGTDAVRWGFEFTIPLTLARYVGGSGSGARPPSASEPAPGDTITAEVGMTNRLTYTPATVRIRAGESVRWVNDSDIAHTVTADPGQARESQSVALPDDAEPFDSGDMQPGDSFVHRFDVPGTYRYFCVPHELAGMVGTVVVEP